MGSSSNLSATAGTTIPSPILTGSPPQATICRSLRTYVVQMQKEAEEGKKKSRPMFFLARVPPFFALSLPCKDFGNSTNSKEKSSKTPPRPKPPLPHPSRRRPPAPTPPSYTPTFTPSDWSPTPSVSSTITTNNNTITLESFRLPFLFFGTLAAMSNL